MSPYLPFVALAISAANFLLAFRYRGRPETWPFLGMVLATGLYSLGHGLELISPNLSEKIFWDNTQFFPGDLAAACALLFAVRYTLPERSDRLLLPVLFIEPGANLIAVWFAPQAIIRTNARLLGQGPQYLAYDYGWWMWIVIGFIYALMLATVLLLGYRFLFAGRLSRRQIGVVLIGFLIPLSGTVLTVTGQVPFLHPGLDITPITFTATNLLLSLGLFRFRLLDILPLARERVFELMSDGVLVLSRPGDILIDWNPAARALLEPFARGRWEAGANLADLLPEVAAVREPIEIELSDGSRELCCFVRANRIESTAAVVKGRVLTIQDVTELRNTRRAHEAARERAEQASAAKSRFLASVSHEIRTPMNALLGAAEILGETRLDENQQGLLRVFRTAGRTLLHMLNDILDISRIEAGKFELQPETFVLRELLEDIQRMFRVQAAEKNIELRFACAAELPGRVYADPQRLTQVLSNLLSNAIKHTRQGEILVSARRVPGYPAGQGEPAASVEFFVEDTGPGIPPDFLERLFEPFSQAGGPGERPVPGTGLGLAIARQLVALMGGEIQAANRPGGGAVFAFSVICHHEDEIESRPAGGVAGAPGPDTLRGVRLLVAEDIDANRMLIERFLANSGAKLVFAPDGREASTRFASEDFDLVLLDVQMPVMDGYESARAMRAFEREAGRPRTPIVALTAYALEEEKRRALDAGMDDHLAKPVNRATLVAKIAEHARAGAR